MTPSKENNIYDMICIYINASFYHRKINLTNLSYKYVSQNTFLQRNPLFWNPKKNIYQTFNKNTNPSSAKWSNGSGTRKNRTPAVSIVSPWWPLITWMDHPRNHLEKHTQHESTATATFTFTVQPTRRRGLLKVQKKASSELEWNPMGFFKAFWKVGTHMNSIVFFVMVNYL